MAGRVGVLVLLSVVILMLAWVPAAWLERIAMLERAWDRQALGERSATAVLERAQQWSAAQLGAFPIGSETLGADRRGAARRAAVSPAWLADRRTAAARLVELACLRAALVTAWGPALGLLLIAGVLDGHWRWRIRQRGFDYPSPVARQASQTGLALVLGGFLLVLLLPLPLHPLEIPLLTLIAVWLIGAGLAALPKRL
ncbi:DUF4400 domain-containing protein [Thiorhodococcus minor]|uniref:DUF4400 domain-containing protein n=1 Tax=Thiorhodococcus minor TaxID=57489 RepID=UPI00315892ED